MKSNKFLRLILAVSIVIFCNGASSVLIAQGVKTIIIDPGHGGKISPGAHYNGMYEKNIVLPIALRVGELIEKNMPDIKVIYTRKSDVALDVTIAKDLARRNQLANSSHGDLFVSVHANAAANKSAAGVETIIMGESSVEQQRNEAALYASNREELIDMSDEKTAAIVRAYIQNLQFTYGEYSEALAKLIQKNYGKYGRKLRPLRRQLLMVLYGANMPAVLTEIGFMTNSEEFKYMTSSKGKEEIAQSIYGGIRDYVEMVNGTLDANRTELTEPSEPTEEPEQAEQAIESGYTVQILSSRKVIEPNDSQFKIYRGKVWYVKKQGLYKYKYCVGRYKTHGEANIKLKEVKRYFSDAFVIKADF